MLRDGLVCVSPRRARRVRIQMILEDFEIDLLKPWLKKSRLPKPCKMVRRIRTIQALYRRVLSIGRIRPQHRRRAKAEILGAPEHPGLPRASERSHRV